MKVEVKSLPVPDVFRPFALTIAFESEKEAGAFFALFNHAHLQESTVGAGHAEKIKSEMINACGGRIPDYRKFHKDLCDRLHSSSFRASVGSESLTVH